MPSTRREDKGWEYSPTCKACTRPKCKYDEPPKKNEERGKAIVEACKTTSVKEVAESFKVSIRTVKRVLEKSSR